MLNKIVIFFLILFSLGNSYAQEGSGESERRLIKKLINDEIFSTQREIAKVLGVVPSTLSGFLNGKKSPKIMKNFKDLCDNLALNNMRLMSVVRHILSTHARDNKNDQLAIAQSLNVRVPTLKRFISGEFSQKILNQFKQMHAEIFLWAANPESIEYAYHLTSLSNIESVAKDGLIPQGGKGFLAHGSARSMNKMQARAKGKVFFTSNYNNLLRYQYQFKDKDLVILRVPITSIDPNRRSSDPDDPGSFSIDCGIQKNHIEVLALPNNVSNLDEHLIEGAAFWIPIKNHGESHRYLRDIGTGLWFFLSDNP